MASIKWSGIGITDAAGKLGSTVFQRNRSGAIMRNLTIPLDPQTSLRSRYRALLTTVGAYWRTLTENQRNGWNVEAARAIRSYQNKLGETKQYSGQQLFMAVNLLLYEAEGIALNAPFGTSLTGFTLVSAVATVSGSTLATGTFTFTNNGPAPSEWLQLEATGCISQGIMAPQQHLFRTIMKDIYTDTPLTVDFKTAWNTFYPTAAADRKIFLRVRMYDGSTGITSAYQQLSLITANA